jgi:dolichol-phosphate mannosyltransferase
MKKLIIIPTYNELENLPLLLRQIFSYAPVTDVLIVDDNSPDGTGELAEEIRRQNPQVHVLHRAGKLGLGTAYIAGFKYAIQHGYDAVFEMDADFSHDPCYLPNFLKAIEHADLVIGSRYIPGGSTPNWSMIRRLISGSGNIFARFLLGIPVHDCTGGFRCYSRQVLQSVDLDAIQSQGYAFQVELTHRVLKQGFKIVETPIKFMDRRLGKSKMSRKIVIEAFTYVLRTRFSKQAFATNASIPSAFSATTDFHPHSAASSVSPTFIPNTKVPVNTPAVAVHVASIPSFVSSTHPAHATNDVMLLDRDSVESVSFSLAHTFLPDLPQQNDQLYRGNIPATRIMQYISLHIMPLSESKSHRGIRPIKLEVSDGDFGATPTFFTATIGGTVHNMVGLMNKNGIYYAFDRSNISAGPVWQIRLSTTPDNFASSSWDGTHLYLAGNDTTLGGTSCRGNTQIYAKRVMTVLLTVYHLECPQKVQTIQTLTQRIFQLNFFRRHIV